MGLERDEFGYRVGPLSGDADSFGHGHTPAPRAMRAATLIPEARTSEQYEEESQTMAPQDICPATSRSPESSDPEIPVTLDPAYVEGLTDAQRFWIGVDRVTMVIDFGAKKYAPFNWMQLTDFRARFRAAAIRHVRSHSAGQLRDTETGLYHLAHAACCLAFLCEAEAGLVEPSREPTGWEKAGLKHDVGKLPFDLLPLHGIAGAWALQSMGLPPGELLTCLACYDDENALRACLLMLGSLP